MFYVSHNHYKKPDVSFYLLYLLKQGEDTFNISSWNLEETEGMAALESGLMRESEMSTLIALI